MVFSSEPLAGRSCHGADCQAAQVANVGFKGSGSDIKGAIPSKVNGRRTLAGIIGLNNTSAQVPAQPVRRASVTASAIDLFPNAPNAQAAAKTE